jgi:bifunctional oligoribonuclease and PAP phosphatase NrnA
MTKYYPQFAQNFLSLIQSIKNKKVLVQGHERPDGDSIGSQVALCRCLNKLGIDAVGVNSDPIPKNLKTFLADTPIYNTETLPSCTNYLAINLDCPKTLRVGEKLHEQTPQILANIDHHISNEQYAQYNFVHPDSSSTAQILAGLFLDHNFPIDSTTAQALYVGIATDSGQFRYSTTTHEVFQICCELIKQGANPYTAATALYEHESIHRLKLLQYYLNSFKFSCNGQICVGFLPHGIYEQTGASPEDSENLVNYARSIENVQIGVLLEEQDKKIKGSLRAKDPIYRLDKIAKHFNGGGHPSAAGFNTTGTLESIYQKLIPILEQHITTLN